MSNDRGGFSNEAVVGVLIAFVALAAGMLVDNPSLSSAFLEVAALSTAVVVWRQSRWHYLLRALIILIIAIISSVGAHEVFKQKKEKDLHARFGELFPGSEPLRQSNCEKEEKVRRLSVFIGPVVEDADNYPYVVLNIDDQPDLVIDKKDGRIAVKKLRLRDAFGKIIVRIDDDKFNITDGYYFIHPEDDLSKIAIVDDNDERIFQISFLNTYQLSVVGNFRSESVNKILVTENAVDMYSLGTSVMLNLLRIDHACIRSGTFAVNNGKLAIKGSELYDESMQMNPRD